MVKKNNLQVTDSSVLNAWYRWIRRNLNRLLTSTIFVIGLIVIVRTFIIDYSVVPSGSMSHTFLTGDIVISNKMAYGYYDWCSIPVVGVYLARKRMIDLPKIQRGDIIVLCGKKDYITKRVIGLPGDIITWDHIDLQVNHESTILNPDGTFIYPSGEYILPKNHHDFNIDERMDEHQSRVPIKITDGAANGTTDESNDPKQYGAKQHDTKQYLRITTIHSRKQPILPAVNYKVPPGHVFLVGDNRFPQYSWDSRDYYFGDIAMSQITGKIVFRLFGSNAKVFNRKRPLIQTVIMFPYLCLRYLLSIDLTRFGSVYEKYECLNNNSIGKPATDKSAHNKSAYNIGEVSSSMNPLEASSRVKVLDK